MKIGSVSINDIRQAKRDKMIQLLKALKAWEEKKKAIAQSMTITPGVMQATMYVGP